MVEDKYIGLALAICASCAIGTSFIITKKGLTAAADARGASSTDELAYLKNPLWWAGITTLAVGEVFNFSAYAFAPAILVTPLGALSVIIGAVLASIFLNERLGRLGICGCALCLIGSLVIIMHAPADPEIETIDQIWNYAVQPTFLFYLTAVTVFSVFMIFRVMPTHGKKNPVVYLSVCSVVGSISVMAIKGLGVAIKLTFAGDNQFTHPTTYLFGAAVAGSIMVQMNYFNKALETFSTNVVNPIYYVFFSTATIFASLILFQGMGTTDAADSVSLVCGFLVIFMGVYLLNLSREPDAPHHRGGLEAGLMNPRQSIGGRFSSDDNYDHLPLQPAGSGRRGSLFRQQSDSIFDSFNEESTALNDVREEDEGEDDLAKPAARTSGGAGAGRAANGGVPPSPRR